MKSGVSTNAQIRLTLEGAANGLEGKKEHGSHTHIDSDIGRARSEISDDSTKASQYSTRQATNITSKNAMEYVSIDSKGLPTKINSSAHDENALGFDNPLKLIDAISRAVPVNI